MPTPEVTNFHLAWPFTRASAVIGAWQHWAPTGPDELAARVGSDATSAALTPMTYPHTRKL